MTTKNKRPFEEEVVYAALQNQKGSPLKDFLSDDDIEKAVQMLADILVVTGVKIPEDE
jgi:hypothetical protein